MTHYTVISLGPDWGSGVRDATFVQWVNAETPSIAGYRSRHMRALETECLPDEIEILAAFIGLHDDEYDPSLDNDEYRAQVYRKERGIA